VKIKRTCFDSLRNESLDFGPCNGSKVSIVAFPDLTAEPVAEAAEGVAAREFF